MLALTSLGAALAGACSKAAPPPAQQQAPPPPQVGVVSVAPTTIAEPYEFGAQVQPFRRVEVRSRVDGIIVERPFTEGSVVKKGQVLYRLDQVRYEAAYRSARGATQQREAHPRAARAAGAQARGRAAGRRQRALRARSPRKRPLDAAKKDLDDA